MTQRIGLDSAMDVQDPNAVPTAFLGILFLYSGASKILSLRSFIQTLLLVPYFPYALSSIAVWMIPLAEIVVGILVLLNFLFAKVVVIVFLLIFSIAALTAHNKNQNKIPCNCFGAAGAEYLSLGTVVSNLVLASIAVATIAMPSGKLSVLAITFGAILLLLMMAVMKARDNWDEFVEAVEAGLL
jgi:Methylamine utilisation protein MauE